jgi:hypothetical protein
MRLNVPTIDGAPIVSGLMINSMTTLPVKRGDDGRYYIDGVTRQKIASLRQGKHGLLWDQANPLKPLD